MSKQFIAALFLLSILAQTALSANKISLKERKLPAEELNSVQATLGAGAFLLGFLIQDMMSESTDEISANNYNPLFFNIINEKKTKELELLVTYMKTYQKDLNNACRMVFNIKKSTYEAEVLKKLKDRCDLWTAHVFKLISLNFKFFHIEFAYKYFFYLQKSKAIPIAVLLGEALDENVLIDAQPEEIEFEEKRRAIAENINELFFTTLGKVIDEVLNGEDSIIHSKFHLIQRFYGSNFVKIFAQILDDNYRIIRKTVDLNEFEQSALDTMFQVPVDQILQEKERVENGEVLYNIHDLDIKGVTSDNLYRFYGSSYEEPFYRVNAMYMIDM